MFCRKHTFAASFGSELITSSTLRPNAFVSDGRLMTASVARIEAKEMDGRRHVFSREDRHPVRRVREKSYMPMTEGEM